MFMYLRKRIISTLITLTLILLVMPASARAGLQLHNIEDALQERGLDWKAGDTLLGLLSPDEKAGYAGLSLPTLEDQAQADLWAPETDAALPYAFDWRSVGGASWIGPVQDQMGLPVSYALAGVQNLEDLLRIRENDPDLKLSLTAYPLLPEDPAGDSLVAFLNVLVRFGAPVDASDVKERYTAHSWQWVTLDEPDVEAIKQAVFRGPVLAIMNVYEDFLFYQSGVYESLGLNFLGAHVVRIVGWDNAERSWIVQNSWGENWGENGYARILWDDPYSLIGRFAVIQHVDPISGPAGGINGAAEPASGGSPIKQVRPLTTAADVYSPIFQAQDASIVLQSAAATLAWDASPNASWYLLEVNTSSAWDTSGRIYYGNVGGATSRVMDGLETGVVYYWRVWAGNDAGESAPAEGPSFMLQAVTPTYAITSSAGTNGSISPLGTIPVTQGSGQTFTTTPDSGYEISDVRVDGVSVGKVSTYTFTDVQSDHTISVSFQPQLVTYAITATAGPHGGISPAGETVVERGSSQTYAIQPDRKYEVDNVLVDGVSVGSVTSYTFTDVQADHTISVSFKRQSIIWSRKTR